MIIFPVFLLALFLIPYIALQFLSRKLIYPLSKIPFSEYTLVLGAGLDKNGSPSDILADRVKTAVSLINNNKTKILFLSGSGKSQISCEPDAMRMLANSYGINNAQIQLDYLGYSTFHSCQNISNLSRNSEVTIVTQMFHLPRALWLAQCMGISAIGTPANQYKFSCINTTYWYIREIIAFPFNFIKLILFQIRTKGRNI